MTYRKDPDHLTEALSLRATVHKGALKELVRLFATEAAENYPEAITALAKAVEVTR